MIKNIFKDSVHGKSNFYSVIIAGVCEYQVSYLKWLVIDLIPKSLDFECGPTKTESKR